MSIRRAAPAVPPVGFRHGWCDLLIGLIQLLERTRQALRVSPDVAKNLVIDTILGSSMQRQRPDVTTTIVNVLVDKACSALVEAVALLGPVLLPVGRSTVCALRILALFIRPAPERHPEIQQHALRPLAGDARRLIGAEVVARLGPLIRQPA